MRRAAEHGVRAAELDDLQAQAAEETAGEPIPPSIALAWGLRGRGTRGPKPELTLERIAQTGIELADREGIDAVSMARLAAELGAGTMSLYRYVASKDELLTLMVDTGLGPARVPAEVRAAGWRAALAWWARSVREAYGRHPWSLKVPITAPPLGPNNVDWMEEALEAMTTTPLSEPEKLSTLLLSAASFVTRPPSPPISVPPTARTPRRRPTGRSCRSSPTRNASPRSTGLSPLARSTTMTSQASTPTSTTASSASSTVSTHSSAAGVGKRETPKTRRLKSPPAQPDSGCPDGHSEQSAHHRPDVPPSTAKLMRFCRAGPTPSLPLSAPLVRRSD